MWYFIFAAMFVAMVTGVIYLITRFYKTETVKNLSKNKKWLRIVLSAVPIFLVSLGCYATMGIINAVIVIVHMLCIWIILDIIVAIIKKISKKTFSYDIVVVIGIVILAGYFPFGWYEAHHVVATRYDVKTDKKVEPLKVVQITDSHVGATFDGEGFAAEMEKIQKENPDIVVITGDFVDDDTSKKDMLTSCEALGKLETTYGVYFVFGNHDKGYFNNEVRGYDANGLIQALEENHVTVLQDENVEITENYVLVGRQDKSEETYGNGRASMDELMKEVDATKYSIVLDHQPNDYAAQEEAGVDLVLSGHTHGGQFFPINKLGELAGLNDMTYGMRKSGNTVFEVSSGISDWAIKFKTGCISEYVVLEIH